MSQDLSFSEALDQLDDIVAKVKQKDISLEASLDLLEQGVKLANICTERTDHSNWREEHESSE